MNDSTLGVRTTMRIRLATATIVLVNCLFHFTSADQPPDMSFIDNGDIRVGIDPNKGGAICWLSSRSYPKNIVNLADPGRLIQQSYYAGKSLNRQTDGQHSSWSPWSWNPIQGGGVGAWAKASHSESKDGVLYTETTPKLWDMHDEDAKALMRQWTSFEKGMPNTIVVRCQFQSLRESDDPWSTVGQRAQEVPACYFVRSFSNIENYLGKGQWQALQVPPGPPWGKTSPPRKALAMFNEDGEGVALFSPTASGHWNLGPHANGNSDQPTAKPCMHVAPISKVQLGHQSTYEYRYWLVVGDRKSIENSLEKLVGIYSDERAKLVE